MADESRTATAQGARADFALAARAQSVARNLQTPENLGRVLAADLVDLIAARNGDAAQEVTLSATITVRPAEGMNGDGTAETRSNCLRITLCYEDPVAMQSVCRDAYIC